MNKYKFMNIEGNKGSSLFYKPIRIVDQQDYDNFIKLHSQYTEKYDEISDDRSCAIIGALIIENEVDKLLSKWIKKYKSLLKNKDFTFSFKVQLAKALNLIPAKILNAIEPVRQIRNIFAHNLEITNFNEAKQLKPEIFQRMANKKNALWDYDILDELEHTGLKEVFQNLTMNIFFALFIYIEHIEKVKKYLSKEENILDIMDAQ